LEFLRRLVFEVEGADAVEYALVIAFIALAIVAGAVTLGGSINNKLSAVAGRVNACPNNTTSC
jgi:pilus assembly protein Flp/PilA